MTPSTPQAMKHKKALISRINRIAGQVNGLKNMVDHDRACADIVLQVAAVRAAVGSLGVELIKAHLNQCLSDAIKKNNTKEISQALTKVLGQMLK